MKKVYVLGLMFSLLFGGAGTAFGQTPSTNPISGVYISEVNWAGSSRSLADEWLEITNGSRETVDLGGWIVDGAATGGGAIQIAPATSVAPGSTLLIANYNEGDAKTTLGIKPNLVTSAVSLANSNLTLRLIDPTGVVHDTLAFGSSPSAGTNNPFASAVRTKENTIVTASSSEKLLDANQLGTPGVRDIEVNGDQTAESAAGEAPAPEETTTINEPSTIEEPTAIEGPLVTQAPDAVCCGCNCVEENNAIEESNSTSVEGETLFSIGPEQSTSATPTAPPTAQANESAKEAEETPEEETASTEPISTEPASTEPTSTTSTVENHQEVIIISEFVSDPADGTEWVELFNPSTHHVDVTGMYLADAAGGKTVLAGTMEAHAYSVVENPKGKLNNDSDSLLLYTKEGDMLVKVQYGTEDLKAPKKGESIGLINENWEVLATPSKGGRNIPNAPEESEEVAAEIDEIEGVQEESTTTKEQETAEVPTAEENSVVTIVSIAESPDAKTQSQKSTSTKSAATKKQSSNGSSKKASEEQSILGVLTVEPGVLGKQIAYLEGYQLYFNKAEWPELKAGDSIRANGIVTNLNGERRMKITNAESLSVINHVGVTPRTLDGERLTSEYVGYTFMFEVTINERQKRDLKTQLGETTLRVHLPKTVNGNLLAEDTLHGKGILRSNKDGFYIEVLAKEDLILASNDTEEKAATEYPTKHKGSRSKSVAGAGLFTGTLGALSYWLRKSLIIT